MKYPEEAMQFDLSKIAHTNARKKDVKQQKLRSYLELGRYLSILAKRVPSTKHRGQVRKDECPESELLDAAVVTNSKWLYEALNDPDHEAADILAVLRVESIFDLGIENPTTIRRLYREAKKHLAA